MSQTNRHPDLERYLELLAGESIGDLSTQESEELAGLRLRVPPIRDEHGRIPTAQHADLVLGTTLAASVRSDCPPLPAALHNKIYAQAIDSMSVRTGPTPTRRASDRAPNSPLAPAPSRRWLAWAGWAVAACAALFVGVQFLPSTPPTKQEALLAFINRTTETVRVPLTSRHHAAAPSLNAEVIWHPDEQTGYLRVSGLPVNDPARQQYQLWIADATREGTQPVDGGVFNATDGFQLVDSTDVYIPFTPRLRVGAASSFTLTIEKSGGVVETDPRRILAAGDAPVARDPSMPVKDHWPPR